MKNLLIVLLVSSFTLGLNAQKYQSKSKGEIIGLKLGDDVLKKLSSLDTKEFYIKEGALMLNDGYAITKGNKGSYFIHVKGTPVEQDSKIRKQFDIDIVFEDDDLVVVFICSGCGGATTSCLIGYSDDVPACTAGCVMCSGEYEMIPMGPRPLEVITSTGF